MITYNILLTKENDVDIVINYLHEIGMRKFNTIGHMESPMTINDIEKSINFYKNLLNEYKKIYLVFTDIAKEVGWNNSKYQFPNYDIKILDIKFIKRERKLKRILL
jgi:hypothetical protein